VKDLPSKVQISHSLRFQDEFPELDCCEGFFRVYFSSCNSLDQQLESPLLQELLLQLALHLPNFVALTELKELVDSSFLGHVLEVDD